MTAYPPRTFDVAISFVAADEPLALQLRELLQPPLNVFVYSKAQEQLAGRDGIDAFRDVFRNQAKLVVLLHRLPWGTTPWTRVEETAIKEFCMDTQLGWSQLLCVRLSDDARMPGWVPKPHLYLDLRNFTLADLAGAVKARLMELGVEIKTPTPAERAGALARRNEFDAETERLLSTAPTAFTNALGALQREIERQLPGIAESTGWSVESGEEIQGGFGVTIRGRSIILRPHELWANTAREAYVSVEEFDSELAYKAKGMRYLEMLRSRGSTRLSICRLPDLGWCWQHDERTYTSEAAGAFVLEILLELTQTPKARPFRY